MRPPVRAFLLSLLLLISTTAFGQALTFGEPFPLTNTRYGASWGYGKLATDGRSAMLFWSFGGNHARVAKIVEGERRGGRAIFESWNMGNDFDAVWTGERYLVAGRRQSPTLAVIEGRLLDAAGEPAGPQFPIVTGGSNPNLAANGATVLMLYRPSQSTGLRFVPLTNAGVMKREPASLLAVPNESPVSYDVASNGDGFAAVVTTSFDAQVYFFDAEGQLLGHEVIATLPRGASAIASNGDGYLVVTGSENGVHANLVSDDLEVSQALVVETEFHPAALSATATSTSWVIGSASNGGVVHFAYVDAAVRQTLGREDPLEGYLPSLVTIGGQAIAAWRSGDDGTTHTSPLPLIEGEAATHAAGEQTLLATATSDTGTLVVWRDTTDLETTYRAGIRSRDGDWTERLLTEASGDHYPVSAASNGSEFVVVLKPGDESSMVAFRLDSRGRTLGVTRLPFFVEQIAARGTEYVLAGVSDGLTFATLSASGVLSPVVTHEQQADNLRIAVNGTTTLVTWVEPNCPILCPGIIGYPYFRQFNAAFAPIGAARNLPGEFVEKAEVVADGSSFVIVWPVSGGIMSVRVTGGSNDAPALTMHQVPAQDIWDAGVIRTSQGLAYTWKGFSGGEWRQYIDLLASGGTRRYELTLDRRPQSPIGAMSGAAPAAITNLANGDLALLASLPNFDAPHHGSSRIMMTIGTFAGLQPVTAAPQLSVANEGTRVRLTWIAPPMPVNGYRIEYRIGDGSWNEVSEWYDPTDTTELLSRNERPVAYRIRAFTDSGASEYSNVVHTGVPKRRSAR